MSEDLNDERTAATAALSQGASAFMPAAAIAPISSLSLMQRAASLHPAAPAAASSMPTTALAPDVTVHSGKGSAQANPGMFGYMGDRYCFVVLCVVFPGWSGPRVSHTEHCVNPVWTFGAMSTKVEDPRRPDAAPFEHLQKFGVSSKALETMTFSIYGRLEVPPGHCLRRRAHKVTRRESDRWLVFEFETEETPALDKDEVEPPSARAPPRS